MTRILTIARVVWLEMIRRKDFYVLLILLGVLLFALMSVNIFGLGSTVRYLVDIGLLMAWLFSAILAVTLTGRQLPEEQVKGTIFPLLAKPVKRMEVLLGKWLGAWLAVSLATALFYVVTLGVMLVRGARLPPVTVLQAWILHVMSLGITCALALAFSTRMSGGAGMSVSFVTLVGCHLVVPRIPQLLVHAAGLEKAAMYTLYYALPHLELFDMRQRVVHDWGPVSWPIFMWVAFYGVLIVAILLLISWLSYRHRKFKRGAVV